MSGPDNSSSNNNNNNQHPHHRQLSSNNPFRAGDEDNYIDAQALNNNYSTAAYPSPSINSPSSAHFHATPQHPQSAAIRPTIAVTSHLHNHSPNIPSDNSSQYLSTPQYSTSSPNPNTNNNNNNTAAKRQNHISFALNTSEEINLSDTNIHQQNFSSPNPASSDLGFLAAPPSNSYNNSDNSLSQFDSNASNSTDLQRDPSVMIRHRWGTQRHKKGRPVKRSKSLFGQKRVSSHGTTHSSENNSHSGGNSNHHHHFPSIHHHGNNSSDSLDNGNNNNNQEGGGESHGVHKVFFNIPLPEDMINEETGIPDVQYPRNKIRTTKYTPLSFLPKNLFYQFQNVANIYFLFIVILGVSMILLEGPYYYYYYYY